MTYLFLKEINLLRLKQRLVQNAVPSFEGWETRFVWLLIGLLIMLSVGSHEVKNIEKHKQDGSDCVWDILASLEGFEHTNR